MSHATDKKSDKELLFDKIKDVKIAMMTTAEADGALKSRPMATQDPRDLKDHDYLWFFTQATAPKVEQVAQHQQVNLSYAKPDDNLYVSVSGTAELVVDRKRVKDLWRPFYKVWFPRGEDDPELALLKVHVESAEFWDTPSHKAGLLYRFTKSAVKNNPDEIGEDVKLDMR